MSVIPSYGITRFFGLKMALVVMSPSSDRALMATDLGETPSIMSSVSCLGYWNASLVATTGSAIRTESGAFDSTC